VIRDPRLASLCAEAKATVAALCAQRLLDEEALVGVGDEKEFAVSWVPVFRDVWNDLETVPSPTRRKRIERSYKSYLNSPYANPQTEEEAEVGDNNAVAAAVYATRVYLFDDLECLRRTINRLFQGASWRLSVEEGDRGLRPTDFLAEDSHPIVQTDVRLVLAALDILGGSPWSPGLATAVHRLLKSISDKVGG
jgi:hypothetical protein